jgi:xylan 1,4-beta-xylosidase
VNVSRVDDDHGNTLGAYKQMGSPVYPTEKQVAELNAATALPPPEQRHLENGRLDLKLQVNALVLVELPKSSPL